MRARSNDWKRVVGALALATALACGGGEEEAAAPAAAPAADEARELNLFAWSEYLPQGVIDEFTAETGIQVNYERYGSNEEMLAKLTAGGTPYDLVQPSEYTVEAMVKEGLLVPLDKSLIPNLKNIGPEYMGLQHDPELAYSVPYMQGTVGIAVNTEKITEPVDSYAAVFQEKYKGRIVVLDDSREVVSWALESLGLSANDVTPETLEKVKPVLAKWLPLVKIYDSDSPKTSLLSGDVDLGIVWSGEGAILINEGGGQFAYVLPKEGAHMFIDSFAIPKGAQNFAGAHKFIDYILRPEVSVKISADFPYTNPNVEARKLLSEKELANGASYPPGSPKLETFVDIGAAAATVDALFTNAKAQAGS
ncbi:MAG: spermidine/putrescine ABC transporter substrate-binding protein [Deltaproteobacteria bacterium]|nr:spermidine/putrescine ABC transporter substrate-binding protein [Deltaproteobacteria bacterium]